LKRFEAEFFAMLAQQGYAGLRPKHGAVFVTIDLDGNRITSLPVRAGLSKPAVLALVDELEKLRYIRRLQHSSDRRAKVIRPTRLFVRVLEDAAVAIAEIEQRYRREIGKRKYESLRSALARLAGPTGTDVKRWGTVWQAGRAKAAIPASAGPDIGLLLLLALQVFERDAFKALRGAGYTLDRRRHLAVLNLLAGESTRATDAAERVGISKPAIGKVLDDLQQRGYIQREGDPADRRAKTIALTRRGLELLRDSRNVFTTVERGHLRGLGAAQAKTLRAALLAIADGTPRERPRQRR